MSAAETAAGPSPRDVQNLLKAATARLTGRERGPDRKVRRNSFDVDDPRAQVWSRIADGTRQGGGRWRAALLKVAEEFDVVHKQAGKVGPLQASGIRVLKVIVEKGLDFKTGRSEPALLTIMKWTGYAKATVVRALARLRTHGFISWVRRSRATGNDREFGPQREQTSNAYYFDLAEMLPTVRQRLRDLLERFRRAGSDATPRLPKAPERTARPSDPVLAAALDRMAVKIGHASS